MKDNAEPGIVGSRRGNGVSESFEVVVEDTTLILGAFPLGCNGVRGVSEDVARGGASAIDAFAFSTGTGVVTGGAISVFVAFETEGNGFSGRLGFDVAVGRATSVTDASATRGVVVPESFEFDIVVGGGISVMDAFSTGRVEGDIENMSLEVPTRGVGDVAEAVKVFFPT
jgi:predicted small secreted protein